MKNYNLSLKDINPKLAREVEESMRTLKKLKESIAKTKTMKREFIDNNITPESFPDK